MYLHCPRWQNFPYRVCRSQPCIQERRSVRIIKDRGEVMPMWCWGKKRKLGPFGKSLFSSLLKHTHTHTHTHEYSLSHVQLFATPWTVACQAPLSPGFPRQEYWSGLPFTSPEDLLNPGIEPGAPALAGRFFTIWATGENIYIYISESAKIIIFKKDERQ